MLKKFYIKNKTLFWLGAIHFIIFLALSLYSPFNDIVVLGINSVIKPIKFALSIWIYSWTMTILLQFIDDASKVKIYSRVAVVCMTFEQVAITVQALKGELSHFNSDTSFGIILFSLMGLFILTVTLWTAYITYIFITQNAYRLNAALVLSIKIGLIYFVIFSLFGGYISALQGHTVGAKDGGEGLLLLNWSTFFGDLRVAHFFGIHSLQLIPLFAFVTSKWLDTTNSVKAVKLFSIVYLCFIIFFLFQSLLGFPFMK